MSVVGHFLLLFENVLRFAVHCLISHFICFLCQIARGSRCAIKILLPPSGSCDNFIPTVSNSRGPPGWGRAQRLWSAAPSESRCPDFGYGCIPEQLLTYKNSQSYLKRAALAYSSSTFMDVCLWACWHCRNHL